MAGAPLAQTTDDALVVIESIRMPLTPAAVELLSVPTRQRNLKLCVAVCDGRLTVVVM